VGKTRKKEINLRTKDLTRWDFIALEPQMPKLCWDEVSVDEERALPHHLYAAEINSPEINKLGQRGE